MTIVINLGDYVWTFVIAFIIACIAGISWVWAKLLYEWLLLKRRKQLLYRKYRAAGIKGY